MESLFKHVPKNLILKNFKFKKTADFYTDLLLVGIQKNNLEHNGFVHGNSFLVSLHDIPRFIYIYSPMVSASG